MKKTICITAAALSALSVVAIIIAKKKKGAYCR